MELYNKLQCHIYQTLLQNLNNSQWRIRILKLIKLSNTTDRGTFIFQIRDVLRFFKDLKIKE